MKFTGIHHVALVTGDLDSTIRYWRDLYGLPMRISFGKTGDKVYFFAVSDCCLIGFFEWPGIEPIEEKEHGTPTTGSFAFDHIAIGVEDEDSLYELRDRIEAAGIWVSMVIDHGFIHSIYTFDNNGIAVEFSTNVPGVDVRANPVFTDCEPTAVQLEGPEPHPGVWPAVTNPTKLHERKAYPGFGSGEYPFCTAKNDELR